MPPWPKGKSANPKGRPKGCIDHRTREIKAAMADFFEGEDYRQNVQRRILMGRAPHAESYFLALLLGKPKDVIEAQGQLTIKVEAPE